MTVYVPAVQPEVIVFAGDGEQVRGWTRERFGVELPTDRTAVFGASAGGEFALALGLRHPDVFGAIMCASPGAGFRPPDSLPDAMPATYLVAGDDEPFFHENASRWAGALRAADIRTEMTTRSGGHGDSFWREELPLMIAWAFGRQDCLMA